jgi:menaquinone-specific isochorismate synthase
VRWPLRRLSDDYEMCWTFHVDGLFGATPELLVRREKGLVTSRVLAGTIRRTGDDEHDLTLAATLARSSKDLEEHEYAVRSVAEALAPYCSSMNVPEAPFVLHLPNVMHLATDVAGVAHDSGATVLELAAALHPSAAVGGTPTKLAVEMIAEIEGMDRGRYAGPVGWMNAKGDGEFGIALRSAELDGSRVRLFAGCGIVAGSDPEAELAESQAKFIPVRDALAGGRQT